MNKAVKRKATPKKDGLSLATGGTQKSKTQEQHAKRLMSKSNRGGKK